MRKLGSFEQMVIDCIKENSFIDGSSLRALVSASLGREVSISQFYLSLSRLEDKGYVSHQKTEPVSVRGGRTRKIFSLN